MPCPIACMAVYTSTRPSASTCRLTVSSCTTPVHSRKVDSARPRSLPRLRDSSRRAGEALPVGLVENAIEHVREIAAVELLAHRRLVGHLRGLDEIAPAQFRRIDLHLRGRLVHQAFEQVDRFGPAGAAIGADEVGIGHHRRAPQVQCRHVIDAGDHLRADRDHDDRAGTAGMRADIADDFHAQAENLAVGIEGQFGLVDLVAAVIAGQELLAAAGAPVHRALELARRPGADHVFRIQLGLHAETTADIADDDAHLFLRDFKNSIRQRIPQSGGILATGPQRHAPASLRRIRQCCRAAPC